MLSEYEKKVLDELYCAIRNDEITKMEFIEKINELLEKKD